ncbi:DGQHR domain-containing protein [Achromobacter denitrificans]|uniref:DGQHR domain-containing protein n=1 Tax=Achromobacter denitrificans TaxID=32002 RepID=UPI001124DACE|nr:DGQHR domain-containing protein [Achromobacter denitrificans]
MQASESPLYPLIDQPADLRREYRKRNSVWELKSVPVEDEESAIAEGWTVHRTLKRVTKLQKERPLLERLENKWWILLHKMGYPEMSSGHDFRIIVKPRSGDATDYPIGVFARDEETIIVSKCFVCEKLRTKNLQRELDEFAEQKGTLSTTIKKFYGKEFKPKIVWFIVTENVIWPETVLQAARKQNIRVITENELPYYTQLVEHLGRAARFQFLAEFLKDQDIPGLENVKVPATRGRLGGKTFYSFVTTPRHLLKIGFVNHRTLDDPDGHPTYQRLIQKTRLKAIGQFIADGGYFPNNLLINFTKEPRFDAIEKDVFADVHYGQLFLPSKYKSAWIIDGQHRLYGYANLPERYLDDKLIIVAFSNLKKNEEAELFVKINHEQRSVPKNLLDDLEGQLKWGSDNPAERVGALAARLIHQLNKDLSSPFRGRFTAEGLPSTDRVCLTIPQVKSGIRRSKLVGSAVTKAEYERGGLCGTSDNSTLIRALKIFNGFFSAIQNADLARWDKGREGRVCTNEGIQAFTLLLGEIVRYLMEKRGIDVYGKSEQALLEEINIIAEPVLAFVTAGGSDVDKEFTVPFGSGGPKAYFFRLVRLVRQKFSDFGPQDFSVWETEQREDLKNTADAQIKEICAMASRHIFLVFRKMYGENSQEYWEIGVKSSEIKTKAYGKSQQYAVTERGPLETYLDFIELKKIIEKEHWKIFRSEFDIPDPGVKGGAKNINWMDRINELRRISAHPSDNRNYKADDFVFIDRIFHQLKNRIAEYNYDAVAQAGDGDRE